MNTKSPNSKEVRYTLTESKRNIAPDKSVSVFRVVYRIGSLPPRVLYLSPEEFVEGNIEARILAHSKEKRIITEGSFIIEEPDEE